MQGYYWRAIIDQWNFGTCISRIVIVEKYCLIKLFLNGNSLEILKQLLNFAHNSTFIYTITLNIRLKGETNLTYKAKSCTLLSCSLWFQSHVNDNNFIMKPKHFYNLFWTIATTQFQKSGIKHKRFIHHGVIWYMCYQTN